MKSSYFYILNGKNGATYILNISNKKCIKNSLKFYKAKTFLSKFKKWLLQNYLNLFIRIKSSSLKTPDQINRFLQKKVNEDLDFNITANSSILIAPTGDKVIVHNHGNYIQKFAFNKSYSNVLKEYEIYKLIGKPKYFIISKLYDFIDYKQKKYCAFKLKTYSNKKDESKINQEIVCNALLEFFQINSSKKMGVSDYLSDLIKRLKQVSIGNYNEIETIANDMVNNHDNVEIPLGLVHRDFKPWNTIQTKKLLIYDFEEAVLQGPPLEDLFNYYIDPKIKYTSPSSLYRSVFTKEKITIYNQYLSHLAIDINYNVFLFAYVLERIVFWTKTDQNEIAESYNGFLDFLILKKQFEL